MPDGQIAQKGPYPEEVVAGKSYYWCACGRSNNQPFCDSSHKEAPGFEPLPYTAKRATTVYFCGCKRSANKPLCDGTHGKL